MVMNILDAPIPGESLTKPVGASKVERPPQFSDMNEALEYLFNKMTDPKFVARMIAIMKAGAPAEAVARTLIFTGFMNGKWSVDLALLLAPTVMRMIVSIALNAGMSEKDLKIKNPDKEFSSFVKEFGKYISADKMSPTPETEDTEEMDDDDIMKGL